MKKFVILCGALLVSCGLAMAQGGKVVTPHTVNPEAAVADSVTVANNLADVQTASSSPSGRWLFGLGGWLDYSSTYGWDINFSPDIGYKINNALFVGTQLSYSYCQRESLAGIIPYVRWHIVPLGKAVSVFATAYFPCQFWKDYLHLGARAKPGLAVRIAPGTYLMGSFGSVGYSYVRSGGLSGSGWTSNWTADTIDIGIFFNL